MAEKRLNTRIIHKHETEANWLLSSLIPMKGELIVYDIDENYDYERIKIGDGVQNVNDLPFVTNRSFIVTVSRDADKNTVVDKTYQEIYDAAKSGMYVYMVTGNTIYVEGNSMWPDTVLWLSYYSDYSVIFTHHDGSAEYEVEIDSDGGVSVYYSSSLPSKYSFGYEGMVLTVGENGEVNPADFPETIARTSAVEEVKNLIGDKSVSEQINTAAINNQSDWCVNDESSPAYVKNRTHWVEVVPTTFLDNKTLSFSHYTDNIYMGLCQSANGFVSGDTYNVIWNDVEYTCVAFNYSVYTAIGNANIVSDSNENSTEPFFAYSYNGQIVFITNSTEANNTVSLLGDVTTYHTIDKKYLPHLVGQEGVGTAAEIFNEYTGINTAAGDYSHAEGYSAHASGMRSHAEGWATTASGHNSHAEGFGTESSGADSHAEGSRTESSGQHSHAEGDRTVASGLSSHAEGVNTTAASDYQHVQGRLNITDGDGKYLHIVGNGSFDATTEYPSNAHTIDWNGLGWFQGGVKVGGTGQDDETAKELATQEYVDTAIGAIPTPDVSGQIEAHNTSETAHSDIRTAISEVSVLVGDTTVSEQIEEAVSNIEFPQSDWSQNNQSATDFVKNRTHYEETTQTVIMENDSMLGGPATGVKEGYATENDTLSVSEIVVGDTYIITVDGVDYTGVMEWCEDPTSDGGNGVRLFNKGEYPSDWSDAPVELVSYSNCVYIYFDGDTYTSHSVKITHVTSEIKQLDEKYLPNSIARISDVNAIKPQCTNITLSAANWTGDANPWPQVVTVNGVTANSKVDLQPTAVQIVELQNEEITLMLQNDDGVVTAWAIGNKPTKDYTMQVLITEVVRV